MFAQTQSPLSLRRRMIHMAYCTFYDNLLNRLSLSEEYLEEDYFTSLHEGGSAFLQYYRDYPTMYRRVGGQSAYLVVGGVDRVVLLLEPEEAVERNLPYLAVLERGFFRPQLTDPIDYWQAHIEPVTRKVENVLHSEAMNKVLNELPLDSGG